MRIGVDIDGVLNDVETFEIDYASKFYIVYKGKHLHNPRGDGNSMIFEGNAIGQIGESFVKRVFHENNIPIKDENKEIIHDEYDIISNGKKIEIKTARKGMKNNTFQFNGINPIYNHNYIILIGLTTDKIYYKIISGKSYYDHKKKSQYLDVNGKLKKLVAMNPGNSVNYKLTLNLRDLIEINYFVDELKQIFGTNASYIR